MEDCKEIIEETYELENHLRMKCKRRNRRKDSFKRRHDLIRISEFSSYPGPYVKESGALVRSTRGSVSRYLKGQSSKAVRRYLSDIDDDSSAPTQTGFYRKVYDYWWNLT